MAHNTYVRDGRVQRIELGSYRMTCLHGRKLYDPQQLRVPHDIPHSMMGQPHEMVLHIAGVTYYPTPQGYVLLEQRETGLIER